MSKIGISLKIDVSKIDKARLFKGEKGTYLDATAFIDLDEFDQYGNSGMITQDVTKQEKEAGTKGNILGNTKIFWSETGSNLKRSASMSPPDKYHNQSQQVDDFSDSDIPF